jgi:hypothetical protein
MIRVKAVNLTHTVYPPRGGQQILSETLTFSEEQKYELWLDHDLLYVIRGDAVIGLSRNILKRIEFYGLDSTPVQKARDKAAETDAGDTTGPDQLEIRRGPGRPRKVDLPLITG